MNDVAQQEVATLNAMLQLLVICRQIDIDF